MKTIEIYLTCLNMNIFSHQSSPASQPTDFLVISNHRDVEALNTLSEFFSDFPEELKATISDSQSHLGKIQHPQERSLYDFLGAFTTVFCTDNCIEKAMNVLCIDDNNNDSNADSNYE
jgi:hypothetical protein